MAATLTTTQKIALSLVFTNDLGQTFTTDPVAGDVPQWANDAPNVVTLVPAPDGNTAVAEAGAADGTANLTVTASNNQGGTVTSAPLTITVTVMQHAITSVEIVAGAITDQ